MVKVNLGCGVNYKQGWINIDKFSIKADLHSDINKLNINNESVDLIYCSHVLEHIPFTEEKIVWDEIYRILKFGGDLWFIVPDFLWVIQQMINAKDEWNNFYKITDDILDPQYGFGFGPGNDIIHGELMTHVFGNQINEGQYHRNAYTIGKIKGISALYKFKLEHIRTTYMKGVKNLVVKFRK